MHTGLWFRAARRGPILRTAFFCAAMAAGLPSTERGSTGTSSVALAAEGPRAELPFLAAGLRPQEAAAHLLNRFAFGPTPGDVERVTEMGLNAWLEEQLRADQDSPHLATLLSCLPSVHYTNREVANQVPHLGGLLMECEANGSIDGSLPRDQRRAIARELVRERGMIPQRTLNDARDTAKLAHCVYSENQLQEVMTAFWANHFVVTAGDYQVRRYLWNYERDAIRPHALGAFETLVLETARHPAMMLYLDQMNSRAPQNVRTTAWYRSHEGLAETAPAGQGRPPGPACGLNENYARELLELHTVGVGNFEEADVLEVARALTGWTMPGEGRHGDSDRFFAVAARARADGTVLIGDFLFEAGDHDAEAKTIRGRHFPAGGGLEEGEEVIRFLARHDDTARHLARKFATHFVSDAPSESLVRDLTKVFLASRGDTREMIRAIARHPEFWSSVGGKLKSPLEVAVSSVRALDAELANGSALAKWIARMGEPLYCASSPEGFPDNARAWIDAGRLIQRLNFAVALGSGAVEGVRVIPIAPTDSPTAALERAATSLLPGRDVSELIDPLRESAVEIASIVPLVLGSPTFQYQ